jgi:anhydro-N-acetylmuramic acid kinase
MAERTGIPVVSDFRSRDVAAGGHGAPLVPFADRLLYASPLETRVLVNIGGMANLTRVPPRGSGEPLLAFDTGPGNVLVDAAIELATGGRDTFDRDGGRARQGRIDERLLATLLADPFFASPPPRSTGREHFGRPYVERIAEQAAVHDDSSWDDLIATLTALTARSIAGAIVRWVVPLGADTVILTGGGASNRTLTEMIVERIAPMRVIDAGGAGVHADAKEAIAFAALAWAHVHGVPGNIVEVTGAAGPRILGSLTPA